MAKKKLLKEGDMVILPLFSVPGFTQETPPLMVVNRPYFIDENCPSIKKWETHNVLWECVSYDANVGFNTAIFANNALVKVTVPREKRIKKEAN